MCFNFMILVVVQYKGYYFDIFSVVYVLFEMFNFLLFICFSYLCLYY